MVSNCTSNEYIFLWTHRNCLPMECNERYKNAIKLQSKRQQFSCESLVFPLKGGKVTVFYSCYNVWEYCDSNYMTVIKISVWLCKETFRCESGPNTKFKSLTPYPYPHRIWLKQFEG